MSDIPSLLEEITALESSRQFIPALDLAQRSMKKYPGQREFAQVSARLFLTCKKHEQALQLYKMLYDSDAKNGRHQLPVLLGLARSLFVNKRVDDAANLYKQLVDKFPDNADALSGLASCLHQKEKIDEAEELVERALKAEPSHVLSIFVRAILLIGKEKTQEAVDVLEKNIRRPDLHGDSLDLWINTLNKLEKNRYAQDALEELSKEYPETLEFIYGFAVLANKAGEITIARPAYEKAIALSPHNARIYYELGVLERISGELEKSNVYIEKALLLKPDNPAALRTHGAEITYEYGDDNYRRLSYVAAKFADFSPLEQIHLHYALAKAFEDVKDLDTAFRHYEIGGEKKRQTFDYNEKDADQMFQKLPKAVTQKNLALAKQTGCDSEIPVFILGMPRSGTSLMEQILSSHPDIFGAGELKFLTGILENIGVGKSARLRIGDRDPVFPYEEKATWQARGQRYVEKLEKLADKPYKRIVDKMPGNFNFVGLIHAILPNARIIHSRRHPVETCLSAYRIHFAEGHQWSYRLRELGRYYKRYWRLMKYWREEFPDAMMEVRYEDNVADVEGQAKKLIDYLGLEWNDNCLSFYNTDRPVKTASVTQVRKPIYTTSTNRWRKYEKYLEPLVEELGDIIDEYEAEIAHLNIPAQ